VLDCGSDGLLGAIQSLSAETASEELAPNHASIASHCAHLLFSLHVFDAGERREIPDTPPDWPSSWRTRVVNAVEWQQLQADLRAVYETLIPRIHGSDDWPEPHLAHTAYHVGEIRQMLGLLERRSGAEDDNAVKALYGSLISAWNRRNASDFAAQFEEQGHSVGFDGSTLDGPVGIEAALGEIFAHHRTPSYIAVVREVRQIAPGAALLRAVSGLVPDGQADINPALNAVHTVTAVRHDGRWRIAHFQNTPAQFHGRADLADALTSELRAALAAQGVKP
jgi:uncharacterized protein (TIGR02246 family)